VRYVVVTPREVRGSEESALARLIRGEALPGLELVHASELRAERGGSAGPAVSIYRTQLVPRGVPRAGRAR